MASILMITLIIVGGLALWFAIALFVARTIGRVASAGEHQHQMDLLHRDARSSHAPETVRAQAAGTQSSSASRPSR